MTQLNYKPGVYRVYGEEERGAETPIVYFDGQEWWRPGDDGPPHLSNKSGNLFIDENCIGELLVDFTEYEKARGNFGE